MAALSDEVAEPFVFAREGAFRRCCLKAAHAGEGTCWIPM